MKTKKKKYKKPRISIEAHEAICRKAQKERRTFIAQVDVMAGV